LFSYLNHSLKAQGSDLPILTKRVVRIAHDQNIICSKTHLDSAMDEQTIICGQLFAGHVVGSWPMERKKKVH